MFSERQFVCIKKHAMTKNVKGLTICVMDPWVFGCA